MPRRTRPPATLARTVCLFGALALAALLAAPLQAQDSDTLRALEEESAAERAKAEELRSLYFRYLSGTTPSDAEGLQGEVDVIVAAKDGARM